jgi:hypothetical protein
MTEITAMVPSTPETTSPVTVPDAPAPDTNTSTAPAPTLLSGDTPAEEPSTEAAVAPEKVVPDTYEAFTLPEGVALDPEIDAKLKETAKELGLTQEQAQKIADLGAQQSARWVGDLNAQVEATSQSWVDAAKADPEIGGNRLGDTLSASKLALDRFATPELKELLETSRLGNHPEVIRLMAKVGRAISDDSFVPSGDTRTTPKTLSERLYPNHPQ